LSLLLVMFGLGSERVQTFPIPESRVVPVLVHPLSTTTVVFPDALQGVEGIGFSGSPEGGGDYYLNMIPHKGAISLSVWKLPVPPRNLQVYMGDTLVTLLVIPVEDPSASLFQLHLLKSPTRAIGLHILEHVHESRDKHSADSNEKTSSSESVWWKWGQLEFSILEQHIDKESGRMCIHMMVVNNGEKGVVLDPRQVKAKVNDSVVVADELSVKELQSQQRATVEVKFPAQRDTDAGASSVEVMLGYREVLE
jgi:hypothetical protein